MDFPLPLKIVLALAYFVLAYFAITIKIDPSVISPTPKVRDRSPSPFYRSVTARFGLTPIRINFSLRDYDRIKHLRPPIPVRSTDLPLVLWRDILQPGFPITQDQARMLLQLPDTFVSRS